MGARANLSGKVFGNLTVTEFSRTQITAAGQKKAIWKALCVCGSVREYHSSNLMYGKTKSCGCTQYAGIKKSEEHLYISYIHSQHVQTAAAKGIECALTREQVFHLTQLPCHYCKTPAVPRVSGKYPKYPYSSLDRVDNTKGYLLENVVPCCAFCNRAKSDRPVEEFLGWLTGLRRRAIEEHLPQEPQVVLEKGEHPRQAVLLREPVALPGPLRPTALFREHAALPAVCVAQIKS